MPRSRRRPLAPSPRRSAEVGATRVRAQLILPVLRSKAGLQAALDALTAFNRHWLATHPTTPELYRSGVRYEREYPRERWLPVPLVLAERIGDCEDLAAWRAAELGRGARAVPLKTRSGWHIVVRKADGSIEDPSRRLGMGKS